MNVGAPLVQDVNRPHGPEYMTKTGYSGMHEFLVDNFNHENCILLNISNNCHYHDIICQHVKSVKYGHFTTNALNVCSTLKYS